MKVVIMSDLHTGSGSSYPWNTTNLYDPESRSKVLCILGDVGPINSPSSTFERMFAWASKTYAHVMFVYGNHEFYTEEGAPRSVQQLKKQLRAVAKQFPNVHILDNSSFVVDDVAFIGSTFWTDMNKSNPLSMMAALRQLNDFFIIFEDELSPIKHRLLPEKTVEWHNVAKKYIHNAAKHHRVRGRKVVILTHHAPSLLSIHPKYKSGSSASINPCFSSECDDLVIETQAAIWAHGHTHTCFDYMIDNTRVVCNPHGYGAENFLHFDWRKEIEL